MNKVISFLFFAAIFASSANTLAGELDCKTDHTNFGMGDIKILNIAECTNDEVKMCFTRYIPGFENKERLRITGYVDYYYVLIDLRKYNDKYGEVFENSNILSMYEVQIPDFFAETKLSWSFELDKKSNIGVVTINEKGTGSFGGRWKVIRQEKLNCREI